MMELCVEQTQLISAGVEPDKLTYCVGGFILGTIYSGAAFALTQSLPLAYIVFIITAAHHHAVHNASVGEVLKEYGYR